MAVSLTVAHSVPVAVVLAGRSLARPNHLVQGHALLVHAHLVLSTLGPVRRQARIHRLQAQVDNRRATGHDAVLVVQEAVAQHRHILHAELELLVRVPTVQHAAKRVLRLALDILIRQAIVSAVAVPRPVLVLRVALVRTVARDAPQYAALVGARPATALVAERPPLPTHHRVPLEHVGRAVL